MITTQLDDLTEPTENTGYPSTGGGDRAVTTFTLESTLTCPECGTAKSETMPTDACQWFYECTYCHTLLKPLPGDCCVYCSYGTNPCPPIQESGKSSGCCG